MVLKGCVPVNPAGEAAIVPMMIPPQRQRPMNPRKRQRPLLVAGMPLGAAYTDPAFVIRGGVATLVWTIKEMLAVNTGHGFMLVVEVNTIMVVLAKMDGVAAIVRLKILVAGMDGGINRIMCVYVMIIGMAQVVPVIPIVANRVVPQIYEHTATITEYGVRECVIVIRAMGVLIARLKILAHLVFGFLIPANPMADSVKGIE